MAQVSLRIGKLKTADLGAAQKHNEREEFTQSVDRSRTENNLRPVGGNASLTELVLDKIKQSNASVSRGKQNESTVAIEIVLSASPEYFRNNPNEWGAYDAQKTQAWLNANLNFLKQKYGENLVRVDVHLDEATPHLHAIVVPLETKEVSKRRTKKEIKAGTPAKKIKKSVLNAARMFNKQSLIELQSEAAKTVEHLGIERGKRGSTASHTTIKEYYKNLSQSAVRLQNAPKFDLPETLPTPPKNPLKLAQYLEEIETKIHTTNQTYTKIGNTLTSYAKYAQNSATALTQKNALQSTQIEKLTSMVHTGIGRIKHLKDNDLYTENEKLKAENKQLKSANVNHKELLKMNDDFALENENLSTEVSKLRNENNALRGFLEAKNLKYDPDYAKIAKTAPESISEHSRTTKNTLKP